MNKSPLFSVIIPTYNRANYISNSIQSVINQSFKNWELIIVDDGSTDNTSKIIESFKDDRIKYIYQANSERSAARNNGIKHAKGDYICFLDSDDEYFPDIIENFYLFLQQKNFPTAFLFCDIEIYNETQTKISGTKYNPPKIITENYLFGISIGTVQTCISASLFKTEKFNTSIRIGEDKELWMRLINKTVFYYLAFSGVKVMEHSGRTIFVGNRDAVFGHIKTLKYILKQPNAKKISKVTSNKVLSDAYIKTAYHYAFHNKRLSTLKWLLKGLFIAPNYRTKERLYLIISNTLTGKIFLKIRHILKK